MKKWILLNLFFLCSVWGKLSSCGRLVTISSVKARALAMGGAFVSIKDDLASVDFNPAALSLSPFPGKNQFSLFLNPLGPVLIKENWETYSDWTIPLGCVVRGIGFSSGRIVLGILWGEEALTDLERLERSRFFSSIGYEGQRNSSFGFSVALAPRVSLGVAGEVFIREDEGMKAKWGHRYGLVLNPRKNLAVGLCYFDFPDAFKTDRMRLERLADESLNVGVSYSPWPALTLALDVRNVSDEGNGAAREPHIGIEIFPFRYLVLRGGHYRVKGGETETFSAGVGLFDWNLAFSGDRPFFHPAFGLDATVLWKKNRDGEDRWFVLSCLVRI